jgi:exonuclease SbcC
MIKIDYIIKRDEGDEKKEYTPQAIPQEIDNLVYIKGPNSSGKSTLLNLIALGFFGDKLSSDELNPELKKKINNLINSSHQEIIFDIEVENKLMGISLTSTKDNFKTKDIIVRKHSNGKSKPISAEKFRDEFRLIYDIPINPLKRLPLLLRNIKSDQKDISFEIERFRNYLRNVIEEIKEARDPDAIEKLERKVEEHKRLQKERLKKHKELKSRHHKISKYFLARFLKSVDDEINTIEDEMAELEKEGRKQKRKQSKTRKQHRNNLAALNKRITEAENILREIKSILLKLIDDKDKEVTERYKSWEKANLRDEIHYPDTYETIRRESRFFIDHLEEEKIVEQQQYSADIEMMKLINSLIGTLIEYSDNQIKIPIVDLPVDEFISTLREESETYENITRKINNIEHTSGLLSNLITLIDDSIKYKERIVSLSDDFSEEDLEEYTLENELEEKVIELDVAKKEYNELEKKAIKNEYDPAKLINEYKKLSNEEYLRDFEIFTKEQLAEKLSDLDRKITKSQADLDKLTQIIEERKEDIERLKNKEPHEFQDEYQTIQKILLSTQSLETKFKDFNVFLETIIERKKGHKELSENELSYLNKIGNHLGSKVNQIKHIDKTYLIENIDVLSETIETKENKEIHFSDLGTGQGQAAYLDTLLSMSDDKKIIALFDEVAMMTESTLQPIKEKLQDLYENKKLFMGIIVQKAEEVEVESLI